MKLKLLSLLGLIILLAGCASISTISEANANYENITIDKILTIAKFHTKSTWTGKENFEYYDDFSLGMDTHFKDIQMIDSKTIVANNYKFDSLDFEAELEKYPTDYVMDITQGDTMVTTSKRELESTYIVKIFDIVEKKIIWQGEISIKPPSANSKSLAESIAKTIVQEQKNDGLNLF